MGMAHIQAEPEPWVIHPGSNVCHPLGGRFHDIFNVEGHILRNLFQKILPEKDGLLRIPARIIDVRQIAAVKNQSFRTVYHGHLNSLQIALCRKVSGKRVNGTGEKLVKGAMKDPVGNIPDLCVHFRLCFRQKHIHIHGRAVIRNFYAHPKLPGGCPGL